MMRLPWGSGSVPATPSRTAATTVFVVPRSIPTAVDIGASVPWIERASGLAKAGRQRATCTRTRIRNASWDELPRYRDGIGQVAGDGATYLTGVVGPPARNGADVQQCA